MLWVAKSCALFNPCKSAIEAVRRERPAAYLKLIAMLMPKDLNIKINPYDGMTDEQLAQRLEALKGGVDKGSNRER